MREKKTDVATVQVSRISVHHGSCKFGAQVGDAVTGIASTMQTQLQYLYCMTSSNVSSAEDEILGSCLLSLPNLEGEKTVILPCNISDLNDFMCASTN